MLPGWHVQAIENVNFFAPFKFYRNEPRTLTINAVFRPDGENIVADCRLLGSRNLPNQAEPQVTTHFTGRVRLTNQPVGAATVAPVGGPGEPAVEAPAIYRVYFHGPAYQVVERAWMDGDRIVGQLAGSLPSNHHPSELVTLAAPRMIELCFQTAGLLEMSAHGTMGLPQHVDRIVLGALPGSLEGACHAVVTPAGDSGFNADVVDPTGSVYLRLSGYRTVALPSQVDVEPLKVLQAVMA